MTTGGGCWLTNSHVVQQDAGQPALLRKALPFDSTIQIRHRVLKGETKFDVKKGAIAVTVDARWHQADDDSGEEQQQQQAGPALDVAEVCEAPPYDVEVTQVGLVKDSSYGSCTFAATGPVKAIWNAFRTTRTTSRSRHPTTTRTASLRVMSESRR